MELLKLSSDLIRKDQTCGLAAWTLLACDSSICLDREGAAPVLRLMLNPAPL